MEPSDEVAIGRASRGDRDAFRVLVERHAKAVFRVAYRMTADQTDAEDMVQETFLRAWKEIGRFDGRASFQTWLHRICANRSLDLIRQRRRKNDVQPVSREPTGDWFAQVPSGSPTPERLAQSAQISALLLPALDELTELERAAFVLRHYEGMHMEEIAAALGVARGAAKHSVFRAVQKLRRALEPMAAGK
jgi:RNA polymerase sigma-70 factor (ECF subfamily)